MGIITRERTGRLVRGKGRQEGVYHLSWRLLNILHQLTAVRSGYDVWAGDGRGVEVVLICQRAVGICWDGRGTVRDRRGRRGRRGGRWLRIGQKLDEGDRKRGAGGGVGGSLNRSKGGGYV